MKYLKFVSALVLLFVSSFALADKININTADAAALEVGLVGIGPAKAAAIVKYRDEHGPFKTV